MTRSAVLSKAAMLEAVTASASELTMCDVGPERAYSRVADADAVFPYIVWAGTTEVGDREGYFGQPGRAGTEDFDAWGTDLDEAQRLFDAMVSLFDGRRHPITDHLAIAAKVDYVTDAGDPDGPGWRVKGRLRLRTVETP